MTLSIITVVTVICGFVSSVIALMRSVKNGKQIQEVHVLVNSQLSDVLNRVTQLTSTLDKAGVPVPEVPTGGT